MHISFVLISNYLHIVYEYYHRIHLNCNLSLSQLYARGDPLCFREVLANWREQCQPPNLICITRADRGPTCETNCSPTKLGLMWRVLYTVPFLSRGPPTFFHPSKATPDLRLRKKKNRKKTQNKTTTRQKTSCAALYLTYQLGRISFFVDFN